MTVLNKEKCKCCNRSINIGQPIAECSSCEAIIHGKCFKSSNLEFIENIFICNTCNTAQSQTSQRYNPFSSLDKGDSDKFYDTEPLDFIESINKVSNILENCSLCSISDVNKILSLNPEPSMNQFSTLFLNIDGNKTNFDHFASELRTYTHMFSVIGLAETNIDPELKDLYQISEYNSYYQSVCDGKRKGTGVALYIHTSFNCTINHSLSHFSPNLECIFVTITNTTKPITVGSLYRPHNGNKHQFLEELKSLLENAPIENTFIMGDFNMDLLNTNNPITAEYEELIITNGFFPLISTYTHEQPNCKKTCIDNIITNSFDNIHSTGAIVDKLKHHLPIFQISHMNIGNKQPNFDKHVQYYDFSNSNVENFVAELSSHDHSFSNNPNEDFTKFLTVFNTTLDKTCKLVKPKTSKRNNKCNPWITVSIINSVNKKHELRQEWDNTVTHKLPHGNPILYSKFSEYRKQLKKVIKWSKHNHYCNQFGKVKGDMKKTWELINSIRGKNKRAIKPLFTIDNERITDRRIIANKFNEYFVSIASNMNNQATAHNDIPITAVPSFKSFLSKSCMTSIYLEECTSTEIEEIISNLENGKASDIPIKVIKQSSKIISPILETLFNDCMANGVFPNSLKVGNISPIYKKGNEEHLENYRPVSTLPIFGKIFEKIIYSRLYKFLISKNILHESQFGFRKGHSTSHALNYSVEEITKILNSGKHVVGIFIDLSKAFDTINHEKLLTKLYGYGIRGTAHSLITDYLSNRTQYVSVLGEKSEKLDMKYGVPQGSVLGPLLFLLYINDLVNCSDLGKFVLYADDTNIFVSGSTKRNAYIKANKILKSVHSYMMANQLHINLSKSYHIYFKPKVDTSGSCARTLPFVGKHNNMESQIYINGTLIKQVSKIKFLGVTLDEELVWDPHIEYLIQKLKSCTGVLSRIRHVIPHKLYASLYHSLFESHISYGISVWGGVPQHKLDKLFTLQKKCIRILFGDSQRFEDKFCTCARARPLDEQILGSDFYAKEHTKPLFKAKNLLTVHNLYTYHTSLEIYKILKFRTPISLFSLYTMSERKSTLILTPNPSIHFTYKSAILWNKMHKLICSGLDDFSMKISSWKSSAKNYLLLLQASHDTNNWYPCNYEI